jgi:hypothetical protein
MSLTNPSATGASWIRASWIILKSAPLSILGIVGLYLLLLLATSTFGQLTGLDDVGVLLSSLVTPFGTLAFACAGREIKAGKTPGLFSSFAEGWKNPTIRIKLLLLGFFYGLCIVIITWLVRLLSASATAQWKITDGVIDVQSVSQNIPWFAFGVGFVLYALVLCVTCFSPMLIAWRNQSIGKAFFFSLFVCLRNIIPLLGLGSGLFLIALGGTILISLLGSPSVLIGAWGIFMSAWAYSAIWPMWVTFFGTENSRVL